MADIATNRRALHDYHILERVEAGIELKGTEVKSIRAAPAQEPQPKIFTVSEITRTVRSLLENKIGRVWVEGEICNHRRQSSGHHYFTLKDERSQLACVLFASQAARFGHTQIADGARVQ